MFITKIEIIGLYDRFDIQQEFTSNINIIYGENGEFKTTLLHILTNILNNDLERFIYLNFNKISVYANTGIVISIQWKNESKDEMFVTRSDRRRPIAVFSKDRNGWGNKVLSQSTSLPSAAYFPTFRAILEAWFSIDQKTVNAEHKNIFNTEEKDLKNRITDFLRSMFGDFLPNIDFISVPEIVLRIRNELEDSFKEIEKIDQKLLSESFSKIIDSFSSLNSSGDFFDASSLDKIIEDIEKIRTKIEEYSIYPYLQLPKSITSRLEEIEDPDSEENKALPSIESYYLIILTIYKDALEALLEEINNLFSGFSLYIQSINDFLSTKKIEISSLSDECFLPSIRIRAYEDDAEEQTYSEVDELETDKTNAESKTEAKVEPIYIELLTEGNDNGVQKLSSGERQIISLLYAAHISSQTVILVDEPEISLHTGWQENLLDHMGKRLKQKQLIVCTHAPMIGGRYVDSIQLMNISPTDKEIWEYNPESIVYTQAYDEFDDFSEYPEE